MSGIQERLGAAGQVLKTHFQATKDIYVVGSEVLKHPDPNWSPFGEANAIFFMATAPIFMPILTGVDVTIALLKKPTKQSQGT